MHVLSGVRYVHIRKVYGCSAQWNHCWLQFIFDRLSSLIVVSYRHRRALEAAELRTVELQKGQRMLLMELDMQARCCVSSCIFVRVVSSLDCRRDEEGIYKGQTPSRHSWRCTATSGGDLVKWASALIRLMLKSNVSALPQTLDGMYGTLAP